MQNTAKLFEFYCNIPFSILTFFSAAKASGREGDTGTGNEKRRTLRKSLYSHVRHFIVSRSDLMWNVYVSELVRKVSIFSKAT